MDNLVLSFTDSCLRLYEALVSGRGLKHIADTAQVLFGNPFVIADKSYRVICTSGVPSETDDYIWLSIMKTGYYPDKYISSMMNDKKIYDVVYNSNEPTVRKDPYSNHRLITFRIGSIQKPLGFASMVEQNRPFSETDARLFSVLCKTVASELRNGTFAIEARRRNYEYVISELIEGKLSGLNLIERLNQVNLKPKKNIWISVIENGANSPEPLYLDYICDHLEFLIPGCRCSVYMNTVTVLLFSEVHFPLSGHELTEFTTYLIDKNLICGISGSFSELNLLSSAYTQATAASRLRTRLEKAGPVYYFEDYAFYHMLENHQHYLNLHNYCKPILTNIHNYDNEYHTFYILTLKTYLECCRNSNVTAQKLGIHRNTVDYRIGRLHDLFGLDFSDAELMFSLELSFKIMNFIDNQPGNLK